LVFLLNCVASNTNAGIIHQKRETDWFRLSSSILIKLEGKTLETEQGFFC